MATGELRAQPYACNSAIQHDGRASSPCSQVKPQRAPSISGGGGNSVTPAKRVRRRRGSPLGVVETNSPLSVLFQYLFDYCSPIALLLL
eukprot:scaffold46611_cov59-Phaeocystis_antarctica.AAC.1